MNKTEEKKKFLDDIIMIVCSCITLCLFAPLEIFFTNSEKIWLDVYDIFPLTLISFCGILILLLASFFLLWVAGLRTVADAIAYLMACVTFTGYVIGNFVPIHMSLVDEGESVNWLDLHNNMIHLIIVLLLLAIYIVLLRSSKRHIYITGLLQGILCVQILTLLFVVLISPGNGLKHRDEMILTEKNFQTYSTNSNIEILVLDEFDARVMTELLKDNSEYFEILDGFTYYPDNTSKYNFSSCSVAQMLTGELFLHQSDYKQFLNKAFEGSPLINRIKDEYSLNIYDDVVFLPPDHLDELFDNYVSVKVSVSSKRTLMKYLYRLVGCKYLPFYFRQYCWFATEDLESLKCVDSVDNSTDYSDADITESPCNPANTSFYTSLSDLTLTDKKMFHWHHLRGLHSPRTHDENMKDVDSADIMSCAKGVMLMIDEWIKILKENDIYDNHIIIIAADHGGAIDQNEDSRSANALLMIKGYNEHHDLLISDKKVSYDELNDIYMNLLDGINGNEAVQGLNATDIRLFYKGLDGYYEEGNLVESQVTGLASDVNNAVETGVIYQP